jgi:invasion protein IalB
MMTCIARSIDHMHHRIPMALAALAMMAIPSWAQAQTANPVPAAPQTTTATYQDWTLRCDNAVGTPPHKVCEVAQTVAAPDGKTALAQIVIGRPVPDKPLKLIVQLPNGIWLPFNALLMLDSKTTVTATFKRCVQLCFAEADLDEATVTTLKARTEPAKLLFADGTQRVIDVSVSVAGFTAALDESLRDSGTK